MTLRNTLFIILQFFYLIANTQENVRESPSVSKKQLNFTFINAVSNSEIDSVEVLILREAQLLSKFNSGNFGKLTLFIEPGIYIIIIKRRGYKEKEYKEFKIPEKGVGIFRIGLSPID